MRSEIALRTRFVNARLDHKAEPAELMDLTRFMHGEAERLLSCNGCGLVIREESEDSRYATDVYDRDLLEHLYPRYLEPFREKARRFNQWLRPHAEVVELGSHLGAFLQAAEEENWNPTGLDIGEYTSAFGRQKGLRVLRRPIEDTPIGRRSADALFVWNCFEQLDAPSNVLGSAHGLLKRHGLLVVRIPNYGFYEQCRRRARVRALNAAAVRELAYNNLLGFPYLIGYTPALLASLLSRHGFEPVQGFDSTLVTLPFSDVSKERRSEEAQVYAPYRDGTEKGPLTLTGPWIEVVGRKRE